MEFFIGALLFLFALAYYLFEFLVGLIKKILLFIRDIYESTVENKKKENETNDELEYKMYIDSEKQALLDYKHKYNYDKIKTRLVDDNISEVKKFLKYSNVKGVLEPSKNMTISFNITYKVPPKILEKNAIIDGSLRITVSDESGNIVADGYCVGNTFKEDKEMFFTKYNVGLLEKQYEVICITKDKSKIKLVKKKYVIEIEPIKLWLIEADNISDDILKHTFKNTSNSNITYNHKSIENIVDTYDEVNDNEKYYCERCDKRISKEEYEQYGDLCEECFDEVYYDFDGNFREDYWKYY